MGASSSGGLKIDYLNQLEAEDEMVIRMFAVDKVIENAQKQLPISAICKQADQLVKYIRDGIPQDGQETLELG